MHRRSQNWTGFVFRVIVLAGLCLALLAVPALAQEAADQPNLIINGGFEEGFQSEVGVGYGWGAFGNGNAAAGWNVDSWGPVVIAGQYSQLIEIKNAVERDRYAGIYQTVAVVPGQQYKLTLKGLIRSEEGDVKLSNYGYRLQYGVDYDGGTAWELVNEQNWQEIQWDEQPLNDPLNGTYRFDTFETTITAKSDKLTLFIRAWKKWLNNGVGLYDLDEISLVGPRPEGVQAAAGQVAAVGDTEPGLVSPETLVQTSEQDADLVPQAAEPEVVPGPTATAQPEPQAVPQATPVPQPTAGQLPVSGLGKDDSTINPIEIMGAVLVLVLLTGAFTTLRRRRTL
ncbi:MAG: hypothetical protein HC875_27855 [Anaerolineales bacterium]|nr:hypothetical protein [Anaerolineales bacterium]